MHFHVHALRNSLEINSLEINLLEVIEHFLAGNAFSTDAEICTSHLW